MTQQINNSSDELIRLVPSKEARPDEMSWWLTLLARRRGVTLRDASTQLKKSWLTGRHLRKIQQTHLADYLRAIVPCDSGIFEQAGDISADAVELINLADTRHHLQFAYTQGTMVEEFLTHLFMIVEQLHRTIVVMVAVLWRTILGLSRVLSVLVMLIVTAATLDTLLACLRIAPWKE